MLKRIAVLAIIAACAAPSFASITIRFDGTGMGQGIDFVYNGNGHSAFAGQMNFTDLTNSVALQTYCVDLEHYIGGGQTYNANTLPTLGDPTFGLAGSVVSNNYASVANNDSATALQIAVWASRYGTNLATNSGGTFQLESNWYTNHASIIATAQGMMTLASSNPMDAIYYEPTPLDGGQAQLGPVPEPASMLAVGAALASLVRRRRK